MEYTNSLDTSLDLDLKPLRALHHDDSNVEEGTRNFIAFVGNIPVEEDHDDETSGLLEEIKRVGDENKKLTEKLSIMSHSYNALENQLMEYVSKNGDHQTTDSINGLKKRKAESITNYNYINNNGSNDHGACSSSDEDSSKKPKEDHQIKQKIISRVYVPTEASDTSLIVKDGYQWRKYGQKVTKDNPFPRAYYKCALAPSCPVKKKVQRSVENNSVLVATYEGEHNHRIEATSSTTQCVGVGSSVSGLTSSNTSSTRTITLDLTKSNHPNPNDERKMESPKLQKSLVEEMASSLTKDSNFRAALAAAISGRLLQPK